MTVIVGILCDNGVVIAADGMASLNLGNNQEIPFVGMDNLKVNIIQNKFLVACAGADNIMTFFINFLQDNYDNYFNNQQLISNPDIFINAINADFVNHCLSLTSKYDQRFQGNIPIFNQLTTQFQGIIAFTLNNTAYLYNLNGVSPPTMIRKNGGIWYSIIGSGFLTGRPSMHLIKKILGINNGAPTLELAVKLSYWTIDHVIDVSSGAVGGNISLATLKPTNSELVNDSSIEYVDTNPIAEYIEGFYAAIKDLNNPQIDSIESVPELS